MFKILVVEDDIKLNKLFCAVLTRNGYKTVSAIDGEEALNVLDNEFVDLIISDIMTPKLDGYELTKTLRDAECNAPILMITARESYADKEKGFLAGADDYMVKPINVNEMLLRVSALLRRAKIVSERKIEMNNTLVDFNSLTVTYGDQEVLLPQKEFQLLYKLLSNPNKIFTRRQLMDEIWGLNSESDERTVDVHINRLRERFKSNDDFQIVTVRGLGYKAVKKV